MLEKKDRLFSGAEGRWLIQKPSGYEGTTLIEGRYVYEHRYIMEQKLGRLLKKGEVVHHLDGNRHNNDPENLEVCSASSHPKKHARGRTMLDLVCARCGKEFKREKRQVAFKKNKGQTRFYCSRRCSGKSNNNARNFNPRTGTVKHGSSTSYSYWKCRCGICRKAHTKRLKKYREGLSLKSKARP